MKDFIEYTKSTKSYKTQSVNCLVGTMFHPLIHNCCSTNCKTRPFHSSVSLFLKTQQSKCSSDSHFKLGNIKLSSFVSNTAVTLKKGQEKAIKLALNVFSSMGVKIPSCWVKMIWLKTASEKTPTYIRLFISPDCGNYPPYLHAKALKSTLCILLSMCITTVHSLNSVWSEFNKNNHNTVSRCTFPALL